MSHHDTLHMQNGLSYCWCMCDRCWSHEGRTKDGKLKGRCVCRDCPCEQERTS